MRRFTIAPEHARDGRVTFDRDQTRHLARVLRLRPGDTVVASDGTGREFTVRLETVADVAAGVIVDVTTAADDLRTRITLLQGLPKADKMETIVRATTELGVARIWPVITERTIVRLEAARWRERARRWQRVAREATKQCGRAIMPEIEPPETLAERLGALADPQAGEWRLCLWEGDAPALRTVTSSLAAPREVLVLVGPEGGLSAAEVELARRHQFTAASLGRRILRSETAGPAILAVLQWQVGDLGAP